jgi:catechol 2,3-dioxygenase-like lactoylglutathione lyase family enzyme
MAHVVERPALEGILETVLYCDSSNEAAVRSFYLDVMGFSPLFDFSYRVGVGQHVFLVFNSDETEHRTSPPTHGARGSGHVCFTAASDSYEAWKDYLREQNVACTRELTWGNGMRSFYFEDPAGNVLEIAEGDFWPRAGG